LSDRGFFGRVSSWTGCAGLSAGCLGCTGTSGAPGAPCARAGPIAAPGAPTTPDRTIANVNKDVKSVFVTNPSCGLAVAGCFTSDTALCFIPQRRTLTGFDADPFRRRRCYGNGRGADAITERAIAGPHDAAMAPALLVRSRHPGPQARASGSRGDDRHRHGKVPQPLKAPADTKDIRIGFHEKTARQGDGEDHADSGRQNKREQIDEAQQYSESKEAQPAPGHDLP